MIYRSTKGWQPTCASAPEWSHEGADTYGVRTLDDRAGGLLTLAVVATVVALLLVAAPARAQEATDPDPERLSETTGMEAGGGQPEAGNGDAKESDGNRSIRVGGGCVLIEGGGGEDLAVGSCDEADDAGDRRGGEDTAGGLRRDGERAKTPRGTSERTVTEETTLEETAPAGATDFEESTVSEGTVREEPEDDGGAGAGCPTAPEGETFEATVERAVDGDTLDLAEPVAGVSQVRLLGVNAPELEGEGDEPEPGAEEAASFTALEIEGERVLLELDEETTDPYGRLLAYVWREQEPSSERSVPSDDGMELFNLTLLEDGYATTMPVETNTRYAGCFGAAGRAARGEDDGPQGFGGGPDDEQYEEATGPERTEPELATPEAEEPKQTSPEVTEPTEGTTPDLPEETGGETAEVAYGQYEESEEWIVAEATVPETTSSVPEDGSEIEVTTEPVAEPAAKSPAASVPALPTRQTREGQVPVLPETGGAALLPLIVGAVSLAAGVLSLGLLRRDDRRRSVHSDER